jgi:hypothetical protein
MGKMMTVAGPPPMKRKEALDATRRVRGQLRDCWLTLLEVYEREGWRALGYASWRDYAVVEFQLSRAHAYRLLEAAEVQLDFSQGGNLEAGAPEQERHLRELARLDTAAVRHEIWEEAHADGDPTADGLRQLVDARLREEGEEDAETDWDVAEYARKDRGGQPAAARSRGALRWRVGEDGRMHAIKLPFEGKGKVLIVRAGDRIQFAPAS